MGTQSIGELVAISATLCVSLTLVTEVRADGPGAPASRAGGAFSLAYRAPPACADRTAFVAALAARGTHDSYDSRSFDVEIVKRDGRHVGRLRVMRDGVAVSREVTAPSCDEVPPRHQRSPDRAVKRRRRAERTSTFATVRPWIEFEPVAGSRPTSLPVCRR